MDTSNHICLICSTTIVGLLQYVEHFKSHAVPDAVVSYQQEGQVSQVKKEEQITGDEYDDNTVELAKPNTAGLPNHSLSHSTSSHVYYDETSPLSAFANQEFPDPDIETDALLSPKYNIDFFQSLELKSINEETVPLTKSKLKATQRLSILEDDIHAENLLPITSILSNLDFSSDDDEEITGAASISGNHDRSWSDDDESGNMCRTHPPRSHTGGKWKPGQGPGKKKVSASASLPASSSPAFPKKLPIAGKWKPSVSLGPASRKAIMKGNKKKVRGPLADQGIEFRCNVCGDCFSDRTSYSVHFGGKKHKEAVAERRQSKETKEQRSVTPQEDAVIITEAGVAEAVTVETLSETDGQPKVQNITANVDTALSSQGRDEDQYHCPVCDLYFRSSFVFQTHCETKAHKDGLLKQGFREYRSNDGVIIRVDVRTDNVFTDRQENQLLAAKQPKKLGPPIHLDDEKHECTICRKVFKRKYEMARHLLTRMHRVRAQNKPMEVWVEMLDKYNKYMMRLSLFQCAICQFYFNRQRDFLDHMCSPQHVKSCVDMLGPIMCVACKYKTHKHEEMMQHLQTMEHYQTVEKCQGLCIVRESHTSITCKFCGIQMHSAARMKRHCQLRHANRLTDVQEALDVRLSLNPHHTCPICQKVFKVKTLLQFHFLRSHKQTSFFTCTICDRGFLDQRRLDNHLRTRYHARRVIAAKVIDRQDKFYLKRQQKREVNRKGMDKNEGSDVKNDEGTPNENSEGKEGGEITAEKSDVADVDKNNHDSDIDSKRDDGNSKELQKDDDTEGKRVENEATKAVARYGKTDKTVPNNVRRSSRKRKKITFGNEASGESEVDEADLILGLELRDRLSEKTGKIHQTYMRDKDDDVKKVKVKRKDKHLLVDLGYVNYLKKSRVRSEKKALKYDEIDEDFLEEASKRVFTCTYCDFSALDLLELRKHYNEIHPCDILMCQPCNQLFLSLKAYKIHCTGRGHQLKLREQSGETVMHTCPSCDKRFLQASSCALHVETVHRHPNSEADLQRIQKGSDLVTQLYGDHVAQVEKLSNDTSVSCPECGKFVRKDTLIEHLRLHTGEKPYSCRFCNKCFAGRLTLRRHISSHLDMPLYVCDLCGKEFKRNAHLVKHMQQHDNEKKGVKFTCTVCKVSFLTNEELGRHKKRHGERKYPCTWPGCQWIFINPSELKCHMHTHTKDRTFLCDQCGYGAASKARLKRHVKTHENIRPFACDYCPYKASLKTHLVRHMRIHINSKPFACPYCKFTCNTHENIRKHILKTQKHKGKKLYPCKLCSDFGSNSSSEFKGHLMTVHAEYLRVNAVDSLAVFSGLYKKEEDFTKPKEGSEIRQVTKGRFYKQYTNSGASSVEGNPLKPKKEKKKEKKTTASRKAKVVVVSQEELEAQALKSMEHQQDELQTSLLSSHSQSLIITPHQSKQIVTLRQRHEGQDQLQSSSKVMQLQLDCSGGAMEMTVEQEGDSTASAIEIPHYIEIPNMVIQESLAAAAEVVDNRNNINDNSGQQIFPVAFTVSAQLDDQLQQQEIHHQQQQQQQQNQEELQLQQHIQQLQQQQHQQEQQQQQSSGNENRVFWVEAATSDGHRLAASVDSISMGGIPQTQTLSTSQTNHDTWYTTIPRVHAPSCHEIANLASSLEVVDNGQATISATGGAPNESTSAAAVTEYLPDKYFSVTATQIYNSVSGENGKVVVLDQPASDM